MIWFKLSDPKHQVLRFKNIFDEPYKIITLQKDIFNNIKYHFGIKLVYGVKPFANGFTTFVNDQYDL